MDQKKLQETPEGRELIRRLNFNMLLINAVDSNATEIVTLMQKCGMYAREDKQNVNKLRTLTTKLVVGIDRSLGSDTLSEGFGDLGEYLYTVMDEAERVPKAGARIINFIKYCQRIYNT